MTIGTVSLVGAGPGDPELITLKGLNRIEHCDVVVYDRLIDPRILAHVPDGAERIFAGKASGFAVLGQRAIEALLVDRACKGKRVVRLKGGDPFVFGRGGEEIAALAEAGVPYEVVPGITSAIAVPAAASVPVTHRELASCLTIVTAHEDPEKAESSLDWTWLAQAPGTVVVLMGLERIDAVCRRLIEEGRPPSTPAMAIASGTLPNQESTSAPLAQLPEQVARAGLRSPAVIVIGDVADFPSSLVARELAHAV